MEITNVNDLVGFCPHEDLTGQGKDKFCGFMVPGQFRMNFAGKKNTIDGAKIRAAAAMPVPVQAKAKAKKEPAPEPVVEKVEKVAEVAAEAWVADEEDPKAEEAVAEEVPAVEAEAPADTPEQHDEPAPVKKARRSRKKA